MQDIPVEEIDPSFPYGDVAVRGDADTALVAEGGSLAEPFKLTVCESFEVMMVTSLTFLIRSVSGVCAAAMRHDASAAEMNMILFMVIPYLVVNIFLRLVRVVSPSI